VYGSLSVEILPDAAAATSPARGMNGAADASGFPSMADVAAMLNISGAQGRRVLLLLFMGRCCFWDLCWRGCCLDCCVRLQAVSPTP